MDTLSAPLTTSTARFSACTCRSANTISRCTWLVIAPSVSDAVSSVGVVQDQRNDAGVACGTGAEPDQRLRRGRSRKGRRSKSSAPMYRAIGRRIPAIGIPIASRSRPASHRFGAVAIRVQPGDAEVFIDGERWEASNGERMLVQLTDGSHRIEVRKAGYRTYTTTVRSAAARRCSVNVSLSPNDQRPLRLLIVDC